MAALRQYLNRADGAHALLPKLLMYANRPETLVIGLARGGVVTAAEVAIALQSPLDVLEVRKLGAPKNPELAFGAIAPNHIQVLNQVVLADHFITTQEVQAIDQRERQELERQILLYRAGRPALSPARRNVILVDDGLATGATMKAARECLKRQFPRQVMVAVPVGAADAVELLRKEGTTVICPNVVSDFGSVGWWYRDFRDVPDEEVIRLLQVVGKRFPQH